MVEEEKDADLAALANSCFILEAFVVRWDENAGESPWVISFLFNGFVRVRSFV